MPRTLSENTLKILEYHHEGKTQNYIKDKLGFTQQAVSVAIKRHYDKVLTGQITFKKTTQHNKQHNTINNTTQLDDSNWGSTPEDDLVIDEMEKELDLEETTQHNKQHNTINNTTQSKNKVGPGPNEVFNINLELEKMAKSSDFMRLMIFAMEGTTNNARGSNKAIKMRLRHNIMKFREMKNQ